MTRLASFFLVSLAWGCSASTTATPAVPSAVDDAGSVADAGRAPTTPPVVAEDSPVVDPCEAGFEADSRGACTRWRLLAGGAPTCFGASLATLRDGKVLVLGSCHDPSARPIRLLSAFVFNPDDDSWRLWADAPAFSRGTVTRLVDGRVLVAGGVGSGATDPTMSSAMLFDADAMTVVPTAPLETARALHTATVLTDGRVLVAGGYAHFRHEPEGEALTASVEIFDPRTGRWQAGPPMRTPRRSHMATLLDNGNVVVIGGIDEFRQVPPNVEIYNPRSNTWHDGPSLEAVGGNATATGLGDGSVVVLSAEGAFRSFGRATGFLPATGMRAVRQLHFAIALDETNVLVAGGVTREGTDPPVSEIYDGVSGTWHDAPAPAPHLHSYSPTSATHIRYGVLLHSDNVGFLVYDQPPPFIGW